MGRISIPLGREFGTSGIAGMQSLANMYAEQVQGEQRTKVACFGAPGRALFATIGGGSPRGQIRASEGNYAVVGPRLYSVAADGTANDLGEIEGTDLVDMSYNGNQIDIVADSKTYSFDVPTQTLSEMVGSTFEQACSCTSLASYSLYAVKGTGRFRWRLTNATSLNALDFATAEAESDQLVAIRKDGNMVVLGGSESTEWWYPTGSSGAEAFAKASTAAAGIGWVSRNSAVLVDDAITWVGRDGRAGGISVYRAQGFAARKISPPEVDLLLEKVAKAGLLTSLNAYAYQQSGHLFYVLNSPGEWTVAWDIVTKQWSWRKSGSWSMGAFPMGGWDTTTMALNGSKQIVGSADGNLYELQVDTLTENSQPIVRECTTPMLYHGGRSAKMSMLELDVETGVGLDGDTSAVGAAPVIYMSHSDDNGHTWSSPRAATIGAIGQYKWRCLWSSLGSYRNRILKFRCTDPVSVTFVGCYANVAVGAH